DSPVNKAVVPAKSSQRPQRRCKCPVLVGDALISYTSKRCLLSTTSAQRSEPRQLHSRTSDLLPLTLRQRMTRSSLSQKISAAEHALGELVRSLQSARYTVAVVGESGSG